MSKSRKKPKLDFSAMVATSQTVNTQAKLIQEKAKTFASACSVADPILIRTFSLCDEATVELMLVSRLGLEGLESLRSAMQVVPDIYLEKRVPIINDIVNAVLYGNGKQPLNEVQCEALISLCQCKCKQYTQRKSHPNSFDKELMSLTDKTGNGYAAFLGPPTARCMNVQCGGKQLRTYSAPTKATVFTLSGPRPATKVILKCPKCNMNYGYSKFGNKLTSGERYYDESRPLVEASDVVFVDRNLHQLFASLSMHCWVSFCGYAEVMFDCWTNCCDRSTLVMMKGHNFCTELTRKHVSSAYYNAELECELAENSQKSFTYFKSDEDMNRVMADIEAGRASKPYVHHQSEVCSQKGCGRCWSFDGNWKLGFTHCMYPVKTAVEGMPRLNFPDLCTDEPMFGQAFCRHHCSLAISRGIPTDLKKYLHYSGSHSPLTPEQTTSLHHPIALAQGTDKFINGNPRLLPLCETVSSDDASQCNKDTGEGGKLRMWSRGHFFIVRSCGHIDQWHPIYRSESPSQAFMIILTWLLDTLKQIPQSQWEEVVVSYDNMCHLDGMKAAQEPLPLPSPYDNMWKSVTKVIDELHIKNHIDPKCQKNYHPRDVKQKHPNYNLLCAEQVFTWLSRFKKITCSMNKIHHCFFLHRTIARRNRYSELCAQVDRTPFLPGVH